MITSQNLVFAERYKKFLNLRKVMFCSLDIIILYILNHSTNSESCDAWWVQAQEPEDILKCIFWIVHHLVTKLGQLINIVMGNVFWKYFTWYGGLGSKFRSFLI